MLKTRLAPTPSGYLHIGNAFSFLLTWLIARKSNGKLFLRIDDLDSQRVKTEYIEDIFESLKWLGITYDEGPENLNELQQKFSQSLRLKNYHQALEDLKYNSYACTCSRKEISRKSTNGLYPKTCLQAAKPFDASNTSWRINTANHSIVFQDIYAGEVVVNFQKEVGDFVIKRKDALPAYQVASLIDDQLFGINCIVRGEDLLTSTASQLYLAQLLTIDFQANTFFHHPLIYDAEFTKLSKSAGATSLQKLRNTLKTPAYIYQLIAKQLKLPIDPNAPITLNELLDHFQIESLKNLQASTFEKPAN